MEEHKYKTGDRVMVRSWIRAHPSLPGTIVSVGNEGLYVINMDGDSGWYANRYAGDLEPITKEARAVLADMEAEE